MSKKPVMAEEVFAAMVDQAIQDLRNSGMDPGEMFTIVEECFGSAYARRFCKNPTNIETGYPIEGIFSARRGGENADTTSIREEKHPGHRAHPLCPSAGEPSYHEACLRPPLSPFRENRTCGSEKRV